MDKIFNITMVNDEIEFKASGKKHLLSSMISNGLNKAPNGCHGGGCGVCKIKIISGEADILAMNVKRVSLKEQEEGYALACRVFPKSDIVFEFIGRARNNFLKGTK